MDAKTQYEQEGYTVIRGLLDPREATEYRAKIQKESGLIDDDFEIKEARSGFYSKPDGVTTTPVFWPLIFHERLLSEIRNILGPDVRYTQHSDLHVHHGTVGWHRDSANRQFGVGPDWDESVEKYRIARVAVYLQTYAESGSALGVIPYSHRRESRLTSLEMLTGKVLNRILRRDDLLPPTFTVKPVWVKTEPGDCLIFDQRIYHTGSHIRGPKYAIFLSYGADNQHSRNHIRYYIDRPDIDYYDLPEELARQLKEADLHLSL